MDGEKGSLCWEEKGRKRGRRNASIVRPFPPPSGVARATCRPTRPISRGFETHRSRTRGVGSIDLGPMADASRPDPSRTARSFQRGGGKGARSGSDPNTSGYETPLWIGGIDFPFPLGSIPWFPNGTSPYVLRFPLLPPRVVSLGSANPLDRPRPSGVPSTRAWRTTRVDRVHGGRRGERLGWRGEAFAFLHGPRSIVPDGTVRSRCFVSVRGPSPKRMVPRSFRGPPPSALLHLNGLSSVPPLEATEKWSPKGLNFGPPPSRCTFEQMHPTRST
eukprot:scaffold320_cov335-Pavlova_lutheri.AAC.35